MTTAFWSDSVSLCSTLESAELAGNVFHQMCVYVSVASQHDLHIISHIYVQLSELLHKHMQLNAIYDIQIILA